MYNKQLDTFLTVAGTGSFSKAAAALFLTPSAVIQQINHLEHDLQVPLFNRTRHGVTLTEAGEYLQLEAAVYTQKSRDIRKHLLMIASSTGSISVGTSFMQKIRVLYDVWVLFSKTRTNYQVNLINIESDQKYVNEVDLIEGLYDGDVWQKDWNFLKLFDAEIGCAVPKDHRLASRKLIRYEDLKTCPIVLMNRNATETHRRLYEDVESHGAQIIEQERYSPYISWDCACGQRILQAPLCWQDILADMVLIPCEWKYSLPYGFFYRKNPSAPVQDFLDYTYKLYFTDEGGETLVPVF